VLRGSYLLRRLHSASAGLKLVTFVILPDSAVAVSHHDDPLSDSRPVDRTNQKIDVWNEVDTVDRNEHGRPEKAKFVRLILESEMLRDHREQEGFSDALHQEDTPAKQQRRLRHVKVTVDFPSFKIGQVNSGERNTTG
jgi:hypothetical protein